MHARRIPCPSRVLGKVSFMLGIRIGDPAAGGPGRKVAAVDAMRPLCGHRDSEQPRTKGGWRSTKARACLEFRPVFASVRRTRF